MTLPLDHRLHPNQHFTDTQYVDAELNICYPWWTKAFIDELVTWDLSDKTILEWGSGGSTLWLAHKCKYIVSFDHQKEWHEYLVDGFKYFPELTNYELHFAEHQGDLNGGGEESPYVNLPETLGYEYDIIIVDGAVRNACIRKAVELLSKKGGILIIDNWNQASCGCDHSENNELLAQFEGKQYFQPQHLTGDWSTCFWVIPKK